MRALPLIHEPQTYCDLLAGLGATHVCGHRSLPLSEVMARAPRDAVLLVMKNEHVVPALEMTVERRPSAMVLQNCWSNELERFAELCPPVLALDPDDEESALDWLASIAPTLRLRTLCIGASAELATRWLAVAATIPTLEELALEAAPPDLAGVDVLGRLPALVHLTFETTDETVDAAALGALPALKSLRIGQAYRLRGLAWLDDLRALDALCIASAYDLTAHDFATIARREGLKALGLPRTTVTDAAIAEFARLVELEVLALSSCRAIDGSGLAKLRGHAKLRELSLESTGVTSEAIGHAATMRALEVLDLRYCEELDDDAAEALTQMTQLRQLSIDLESSISAEGMRRIFDALPQATGRYRLSVRSEGAREEVTLDQVDGSGSETRERF